MSTTTNKKYSSNDLILHSKKVKPQNKLSIEQLDSESLNTMDYYKQDSSNKNSLIDELKINNKLSFKQKKPEKLKINTKDEDNFSLRINKNFNSIHKNKSSNKIKTLANLTTPKISNIKQRSNKIKKICCKYFSDNDSSNKICIKCKRNFCKNCFKGNLYRNSVINNNMSTNYEKIFANENICYYCKMNEYKNKNTNKIKEQNNNKSFQMGMEPLDTDSESYFTMTNLTIKSKSKKNINNKSKEKVKNLQNQFKEYDVFLKQIDDRKREIEIKRDISLNILQMMKKAVEFEYEKNMNKLNEFVMRLNKIKNSINENLKKSHNNEIELQINIDINKNTLNNFFQNYEKYCKQVFSRPLFRGYKLFESDNILINYADTYYMNNKEVFPNLPFGNVYIKVNRFTNNYINYLNFSTLIRQNDKNEEEIINNSFQSANNNKYRFVIYMIVNNKLIRLKKIIKDNNDLYLNYESYEEENKILFSKNKCNSNDSNPKKDNFNIKVIISEIML